LTAQRNPVPSSRFYVRDSFPEFPHAPPIPPKGFSSKVRLPALGVPLFLSFSRSCTITRPPLLSCVRSSHFSPYPHFIAHFFPLSSLRYSRWKACVLMILQHLEFQVAFSSSSTPARLPTSWRTHLPFCTLPSSPRPPYYTPLPETVSFFCLDRPCLLVSRFRFPPLSTVRSFTTTKTSRTYSDSFTRCWWVNPWGVPLPCNNSFSAVCSWQVYYDLFRGSVCQPLFFRFRICATVTFFLLAAVSLALNSIPLVFRRSRRSHGSFDSPRGLDWLAFNFPYFSPSQTPHPLSRISHHFPL